MVRRIGVIAAVAAAIATSACSKPPTASAGESAPASGAAPTDPAPQNHWPQAPALCEHRVPAELCTRCSPDLAPVFKDMGDWCVEHDRPESQCLECKPELTFSDTSEPKDWCREHGLPESMCTRCNPKLVAKFVKSGDFCREHRYPESVCPICKPELVEAAGEELPPFPEPGTRVRLASAETARDVGIETEPVQKRRFSQTLDVVGEVAFDANRHAQLSSRGDALVIGVLVDVGDPVEKGQALVTLASASVGADQAQLSAARARVEAARARLERERALAEKGISPRRDVEDAQRELSSAQAELGAAKSALAASGARPSGTGGQYTLVAPFAGTVVARKAVAGKTAGSGEILVEVADLSTMWANLDIPETEAALVRPGQNVRVTLEGVKGSVREGTITRVSPTVDPHSRTVRARVELPNPDGALKAGLFLRAQIAVAPEQEALMVPSNAIQRVEGRNVVFLQKEDALFEPVAVDVGAADGSFTEVRAGLTADARVVTTGAFLLKTEIMKDAIGAGCCETGPE
jgi:cobalt-zinc-cadmium efflux system membrane fusion protein